MNRNSERTADFQMPPGAVNVLQMTSQYNLAVVERLDQARLEIPACGWRGLTVAE
jgi:hypothetical protein